MRAWRSGGTWATGGALPVAWKDWPQPHRWRPASLPRHEEQVASAQSVLGDGAAFDAAWAEGRAMTLEQAIELAPDDVNG